MKKLTFYEQVGIIIPGAVFLFGLLFFYPILRDLLATNGITVGQLGIYLLLSYAAGNLVAALGNVGENVLWAVGGGMPTDWIIKPTTRLVSSHQRTLIQERLRSRLTLDVDISKLDRKTWWPISRQVYSEVARHGRPDRIDTFNGNYGLNRGLASACFLLACIAGSQHAWSACALLVFLTAVYGYRAYRFGVHYGRELYIQFLTLTDAKAKPAKKPGKHDT